MRVFHRVGTSPDWGVWGGWVEAGKNLMVSGIDMDYGPKT